MSDGYVFGFDCEIGLRREGLLLYGALGTGVWLVAFGGVVGILVSLRFGFWYFGVWFSGFLGAVFWFGVGLQVDLLLSCYGGVVCDWFGWVSGSELRDCGC